MFALGNPLPVGGPINVTSLDVAGNGPAATVVAVSNDGKVQRSEGKVWAPIAATLPDDAKPGEVVAIDAQTFIVGTDKGVLRSTDGGATLTAMAASPGGVVGVPVRQGPELWWLKAGGTGVVVSKDGGATWTTGAGEGIAANATAVAQVPSLGLVTSGAGVTNLISSANDGVSWKALITQPPYKPAGLAHSGGAIVVWATNCGADPLAQPIMRLPDPTG